MRTQSVFPSISDWWNYSSSAGASVSGGSLYERLLDGRETGPAQQGLGTEVPGSVLESGPVAAEIARTMHGAAHGAQPAGPGQWWTPECFAGWNGK